MKKMTQVEVRKNPAEATLGLLRRFTKKVQSAGVLKKARTLRYFTRSSSNLAKKKMALRRIERRTEIDKLLKLGKITDGGRKKFR